MPLQFARWFPDLGTWQKTTTLSMTFLQLQALAALRRVMRHPFNPMQQQSPLPKNERMRPNHPPPRQNAANDRIVTLQHF